MLSLPRSRPSGCSSLGICKGLLLPLILLTFGFTLSIGVKQWQAEEVERREDNIPASTPKAKYWGAPKGPHEGAEVRLLADHTDGDGGLPTILILTPVKNAARNMPHYVHLVTALTYPHNRISLGFLDSDSTDKPRSRSGQQVQEILEAGDISPLPVTAAGGNTKEGSGDPHALRHTGTLYRLIHDIRAFEDFRSVTIIQHNFGLQLSAHKRHGKDVQQERRVILAQSRNHLLSSALRDETYVLWVDVDVYSYPENVIELLLSSKKQIVVPRCVMSHNGRAYDLNSWRTGNKTLSSQSTVEEVIRFHDYIHETMVAAGKPDALMVEGYSKTGNQYMHDMRGEGDIVRLDAVGGAMLLVDAELHRKGLIFPPFVYRHRIETEGLSMMALDMGVMVRETLLRLLQPRVVRNCKCLQSYGMPQVEIIHTSG